MKKKMIITVFILAQMIIFVFVFGVIREHLVKSKDNQIESYNDLETEKKEMTEEKIDTSIETIDTNKSNNNHVEAIELDSIENTIDDDLADDTVVDTDVVDDKLEQMGNDDKDGMDETSEEKTTLEKDEIENMQDGAIVLPDVEL